MKIPLIELNTHLNEEYIYLLKDILYLIIFIIISYFLNNLNTFIELFKILFIFILFKHLLFNKIIIIK
tara:strand:- start:299 stop:502 length:204 start_codon:yes stop_codon:yes gene_type:complete